MKSASATVAAIVLALATSACPFDAVGATEPEGVAQAGVLLGEWSGVAREAEAGYSRETPVRIRVIERDGSLFLINGERSRPGGTALRLDFEQGSWVARYPAMPAGTTEIALKVAAGGLALTFASKYDGPTGLGATTATLTHDDPAARKYSAARLDAVGRHVTDYSYAPPKEVAGGLPVSNAKAEGVEPALLEKMVRAVLTEDGDIERPQTNSILILRNGKLIMEEYFWGQSANNPHEISSCTKSLTSILAGIAWDQGKLNLDKPVAAYFQDRSSSLWVKDRYDVTVRNMLSMTSGTDWNDSSATGQPSLELVASADITGYMLNKKLLHTPGSKFNYDNGLPSLAGVVVERATGEPYDQFAQRMLFKPLGITNYKWMQTRDSGRPLAAGGFVMRSLDAAKLGQMMLDDGKWQGRQIVSPAWIKESTSQQTQSDDYPYGLYWHLTNAKSRHVDKLDGYLAIGQGGQFIAVFPKANLVIVITSSTWATSPVKRDPGTALWLINQFIVPAVKEGV